MLVAVLVGLARMVVYGGPIEMGEKIFKTRCVTCHKLDEQLIGPPLRGVHTKYEEEWLYRWIREPEKLIFEEKDPIAVALYEKYKPNVMTGAPDLTDEQIQALLAYIAYASGDTAYLQARGIPLPTPEGPQEAEVAAPEGAEGGVAVERPWWRRLLWLWVVLAIVILGVGGWLYSRWRQRALARRQAGEDVLVPPSVGEVLRSWAFRWAVILVVITVGMAWLWEWGANLGHAVGYAPDQPILFSHKVHAGIQGIDCQYCHYGVRRGRTAGIPPMEVCAGCHRAVRKSDVVLPNGKTGTEEIQKLLTYLEEKKIIRWKRVFWLPDHVYFSHYQHVVVAGIACQTCHGPIEEMHIVEKTFRQSMGFCLDCHRTRQVDTTNPYYQTHLAQLLKEAHQTGDFIRVASIGGQACQHCHY